MLIDRIEKATGIRATTMATSVVEALKALGVKSVVVGTPYVEELNRRLKKFLEDSGFQVLNIKSLYPASPDAGSYNLHPLETSYKLAKETYAPHPEAEAIFVSCGGFRSMGNVARIERETGKPMVTSNQATLWNSLRMVGIQEPVRGYGRLLEQF